MNRLHLRAPSPALAVSLVALVVALGGTSYAAFSLPKNSVGSKQLKNKSVTSRKLKNGAVTASKINTSGLTVPNADNSSALGGQPASSFEPANKIVRFDVRAAFGQTVPILTAGSLSLSLKCVQNGTDYSGHAGRDFGEILIATTQNGALFESGESTALGTSGTDFLNTDTAETSRVFQQTSITTGTSKYTNDYDGGVAIAPDGSSVSLSNEGTGIGVNLLGTSCFANGFAVIES